MNIGVHIHRMSTAVTNIQGRNPSQPTLPVTTGIRLPKLDLPHYKGDVLEWSTFWELFNVSVHQRSDLEPIQKFSYLRSILEGEALTLISGFKLESDKYHQAVKLLQSTYGKKDEIKLCLVKRLLETESPNADAESLQNFRANFECSIRSLESENLDLNELYTILLYTKLPRNISEVVKRRSGDDWLKFDTFKKYLEEEIHNLKVFNPMETREPGTLSSVSTFTINQAQSVRPKTKNLKINVNKSGSNQPKECALCEGEHWWTQCKTYANREKKLNRLGSLRLCYVCASSKHFSVDCERRSCGNGCKLKHHRVLCDKIQTSGPNKTNTKSGVQVGTLSVKEQGQKTSKRSILPTATIALKGKRRQIVRLRGLLDTCAERSFIKRSALTELQYKSKGIEKIALRVI
ncbi:uncharacterized protein [Macrobrachium rosenbergii]|uniref:uncharacterized protein n=1 Tax=Macrobrachium rosenbergii TaxID=79674 RepID=UPI0034D63623